SLPAPLSPFQEKRDTFFGIRAPHSFSRKRDIFLWHSRRSLLFEENGILFLASAVSYGAKRENYLFFRLH
ncbi:MAG: hypothetical protein IKC77_08540, partial [Lentisphaeria bacterium]|nr:hypothetical protein [Lentisphaeria bacterium]